MRQSLDQFEVEFEQEAAVERRRRAQLRQRAAARSRVRQIESTEKRGTVGFVTLLIALTPAAPIPLPVLDVVQAGPPQPVGMSLPMA